jgi:DNA-binding transcriptional ArsR family regulator
LPPSETPTRRAILEKLSQREASVKDRALPFAISLPAISRRVKMLERAGLVKRGRTKQWRPCQRDAKPPEAISGWLEHYRKIWEHSFDRLDELLVELQVAKPDREKH